MKRFCYTCLLAGLAVCAVMSISSNARDRKNDSVNEAALIAKAKAATENKKTVGYVTTSFDNLPDPSCMTHIYYAFGNVAPSYDSLIISKPEKLKGISALKDSNPGLKVSLSIQTLPRDGFAVMTASDSLRSAFVSHCRKIVEMYDLDGLDLDWEFPGTNAGMHQGGGSEDTKNYALLARDLRRMLGPDKTLSFYSNNSSRYNDLAAMVPYVDYVMVSGYNLGNPPKQHQSNLYPSDLCGDWSISESVKAHIDKGVPREKIMIGIPFYARTQPDIKEKYKISDNYVAWRQFDRFLPGMKMKWDKKAKAPYYADADGNIYAAFDSERSIREKAKFIKDQGLAGAFYWHYDAEVDPHPLAKALMRYNR
ncbi:MAG: hypothetical protein K2M31_10185 [Muribaculaceae bacterium]|nr:hypothetical protein [Muribaculaceae bacterium]